MLKTLRSAHIVLFHEMIHSPDPIGRAILSWLANGLRYWRGALAPSSARFVRRIFFFSSCRSPICIYASISSRKFLPRICSRSLSERDN